MARAALSADPATPPKGEANRWRDCGASGMSDRSRIIGAMGSVAVVPEWVVPPAQQVMDYFRIAYAIFGETRRLIHKSNLMTVTTPSPSDVSVTL